MPRGRMYGPPPPCVFARYSAPMAQENVKVAQRAVEALRGGLDRGDPGALFDSGTVAEDGEFFVFPGLPGHPPSYRGRDGFVAFMRTWTEDFEDFAIEFERFIDAPGNRVVALTLQQATGKGSGVPVELRFGVVFEIEDGLIVRIRNFPDLTEALEAAGLSA
jgi:ketosteroid isomerase-like protein